MTSSEDRIIYPPADALVALTPHRVFSAERVGLQQAEKRLKKAKRENDHMADERGTDRRIIVTQDAQIRRWAALHAHTEARLRRWQAAWGVTFVLALGYVLVYTQIGH